MDTKYGRKRRLAIGEQAGTCEFVMDDEGHLCGRPVYVRSLQGRLPKYCDEVVVGVDGRPVEHNGKNAAKARELHGFNAAPAIHTVSSSSQGGVSLHSAPAPVVVTTPPAATSVESTGFVTSPASQVADSTAVQKSEPGESDHPVTEAVGRFEALVAQFAQAAQQIVQATQAVESIAPEARAVIEAAGAAGAAEREVIQAVDSADEAIADAVGKLNAAEERAKKHVEERRKMAVERDDARAEAAKAVAAAEAERDDARAQAQAAVETAEAERDAAQQTAEEARQLALTAEENALTAIKAAQDAAESDRRRADERIAEVRKQAEAKINAATAAQVRAEGEAEELRKQVGQLSGQLDTERQERRTDAKHRDKREAEHRDEIKQLHEYYQKLVKEAYAITGRPQVEDAPYPGDQGASPARRNA
ncbi:hypothetical protein ACQP0C_41995 (plasmid) [Nocardia sp. CA-129566]|uniref:hypothetical protein n=1 Tax=Nocardia sp. CA-129566 TaxID=3239976 RepID=UPI003D9824EF